MKLILSLCAAYLLSVAGCLSMMDVSEMPQPTADCCPNVVTPPVDTVQLDLKIVNIEKKLKALELRKARKPTKKAKK